MSSMGLLSIPSSLPTINLCLKGKVLVRVDMNVPIDKAGSKILDDYRIEGSLENNKVPN